MMRMIDIAGWRRPLLRRWGAFLAVLAILAHTLVMAGAHQPAAAASAFPDPMTGLCITSGEAPESAPAHEPGATTHHQGLFCPICQTLHAGGYAPQAPALSGPAWALFAEPAPATAAVLSPRLVLTDLNPRGPPSVA
jgi:hypothetical protein